MVKGKLTGVSLFASCGIAETYLWDIGINILLSNEIIERRAELYRKIYPETKVIPGDICDKDIFDEINEFVSDKEIDFLLATPPCQGVSLVGKNKSNEEMLKDKRNFLIFKVVEFIDIHQPNYILIENVPRFLKLLLPYKNRFSKVLEILDEEFSEKYVIDAKVLNAKDYGVPQSRPRAIIKMYKKGLSWPWPQKQKEITLREAIGHLPSLEAGEKSEIKWHNAKWHNEREVLAMRHTPEGKSALKNKKYYPKKVDGSRVRGFHNTYKRLVWDLPCHARTKNSGNIGSHNNVHPGRKLKNGTYSDARVLTPYELMLLNSIPNNWNIPEDTSEILIRRCIGESVPPLLIKKICEGII